MSGELQARIREEAVVGRLPLLREEREYSMRSLMSTGFAYAVATWCFLIGGYSAKYVGAVQGVATLVAGCVVGVTLSAIAAALACNRYGLEQIDFTKTCFGQRGARLILIFYYINQVGWSGIILVMSALALQNVLGPEGLGWTLPAHTTNIVVLANVIIAYAIVVRGVHVLNVWNAVVTPGLVIVCALLFYAIFSQHSWSHLASLPPIEPTDDRLLNYALSFEFGLGAGFSWWPGIGFLARNTDTQRNAFYPQVLTMGLAMGVICCSGLFAGLLFKVDDPSRWMMMVGGKWFGMAALLLILIANISASSIMMYTAGLGMRHVPLFRDMHWNLLLVIAFVPVLAYVVWPDLLYQKGQAFLTYNATMYAPISGLLLVDYFWLRKQRVNLSQIFSDDRGSHYWFWGGFNWLAVICLGLGYAIYLYLYDPVNVVAHDWFRWLTASAPATVIPMLIYFGLSRAFTSAERGGYGADTAPLPIARVNL
ncbi:MAG: hypothetical protein FJX76_02110 [Armatimonadetes bacterium]|nr:hypothetical protein [Armatimonadota bacterium]